MKSRILMAAALVAGLFVFAGDAQAFTLLGGCGCDAAPACCEPVSCCKPKKCRQPLFSRCCKPKCCDAAPSCCAAEPTCAAVEPTCAAPAAPTCGCEAAPSCGCEPTCCQPKRCWRDRLHSLKHSLRRCCQPKCCAPSCCEVAAPSCGCGN